MCVLFSFSLFNSPHIGQRIVVHDLASGSAGSPPPVAAVCLCPLTLANVSLKVLRTQGKDKGKGKGHRVCLRVVCFAGRRQAWKNRLGLAGNRNILRNRCRNRSRAQSGESSRFRAQTKKRPKVLELRSLRMSETGGIYKRRAALLNVMLAFFFFFRGRTWPV